MTTTPDEAARVFEQERRRLLGIAYRLTSSWADAEDVVCDAWPRFAAHADEQPAEGSSGDWQQDDIAIPPERFLSLVDAAVKSMANRGTPDKDAA